MYLTFMLGALAWWKRQDLLTAMGIPAPSREEVHQLKVLYGTGIQDLTESNLKSMSGNGMHVAVVGTLVLCILKNLSWTVTVCIDEDEGCS